jgi:hypothetical protein
MQKYVENTPDLYFQFRNGGNHSLKENCRRSCRSSVFTEFCFSVQCCRDASLGANELTDRQDDAERKHGVNEDFQDATAFFFGAD